MISVKRRAPSRPHLTAPAAPSNRALGFVLAAGLIPALLALVRFPGVNGPWYWPWRYTGHDPSPFFALAAAAGVAVCWATGLRERPRMAVATLVGVHWVLVFSFIALSTHGMETVKNRVEHPDITSYYTEAARVDDVGRFLDEYDQRLPGMIGHTQTHPPGPILYYVFFMKLAGEENGAYVGGLFLGLLGGLSVVFAYSLGAALAGSAAGLAAAATWAVLPGVVLMLGSFDAVYPAFTLLLLGLWGRALAGSLRAAAGFGAALFVALLCTHSFLTLGIAFLAMGAAPVWFGDRGAPLRFARASVAGGGVALGLFAVFYFATGYDPVGALTTSMRIQEGLAGVWNRPWTSTVVWDVYDFFLASGWVTFGAFALFWLRGFRGASVELKSFAVAAAATLLIVNLSGLLRAETARVWLFLQPFAITLVGVELARWSEGRRYLFYAALLFALAVLRARMAFI